MTPFLSAESDTISFWEPPSTRAGHLSPRLLVAAQKKIAGNLCFYTLQRSFNQNIATPLPKGDISSVV